MPETGEQATTETEAPEGTTTEQQTTEPAAGASPDIAALEAKAATAAQEAIAERKKRQELEAKVAEFEASQLSEKEKAEKRAAEAEARAQAAEERSRTLAASVAIAKAATELRFIDNDAAAALVGAKAKDWDFGGDLDEQAKAALGELAKAKPHLISAGTSAANGQTRSGATLTAEDYQRMTPEQVAAQTPAEREAMLAVLSKA